MRVNMRILSALLFLCGAVSLYFGVVMFVFFSGEADKVTAVLVKSSVVLTAETLLCISGWLWFRAKRDLSIYQPEKAMGQSRRQIRRSMVNHIVVFSSTGPLLVILVVLSILNR